tara:strand:- start:1997 stop:2704 length:708 start_codon:yes stop_codon:yes gene_type:complete
MINHVVKDIIPLFKTSVFIETGIDFWNGTTHYKMREWFPDIKMYEVELNSKFLESKVYQRMKKEKNTIVEVSDSETFLGKYLNEFSTTNNPLFFLDAHSSDESPLKEEIKILLDLKNKPILCIDDFKTPIKKESGKIEFEDFNEGTFRWDVYGGQDCGLEMIQNLIEDRTDSIYYCTKPSVMNKNIKKDKSYLNPVFGPGMGIIFLDRYESELNDILSGLPLLRYNFINKEYKYL